MGLLRWLAQVREALTSMRHPRVGAWGWAINRTALDYGRLVRADRSPIVIACIRWIQRTFSEAPLVLERWVEERQEWEVQQRGEILDLLERPNPYYSGAALWKATLADLLLTGTAYWLKVRSRSGRVVQLWWAPSSSLTPEGDPRDDTVYISHYTYRPGGSGSAVPLRVEDVVQFRDGIDPADPRRGLSPLASLLREVFTDDEAANMTASLLRNMGVPGVVIAPAEGLIGLEAMERIKTAYQERFTGDRRGEPLVLEGAIRVEQFGFSPEQLQLRALRGIPEERITAVLGVNAAVVGLGAGLATTKVGATLREYREEAVESTICPLYREIASELTHQLLGDFRGAGWRLAFDLRRVRVLQDDEIRRSEWVRGLVRDGLATVAEGRRALGLIALPEHEVYLRPRTMMAIPAGLDPEDQASRGARGIGIATEETVAALAALGRNGHG